MSARDQLTHPAVNSATPLQVNATCSTHGVTNPCVTHLSKSLPLSLSTNSAIVHCRPPQSWPKWAAKLKKEKKKFGRDSPELSAAAGWVWHSCLPLLLSPLPSLLLDQPERQDQTNATRREREWVSGEKGRERERGTVPMKGSQNGGRTGQGKPGVGLGNDNALWDRGWAQINSVRHRPCVQQDTTQPSTWWGKKQETKKRLSGYDLRANRHNTGRRGEGGPWVYVLSFCSCQNGIQQNTWEWAETRTTTNMHICIYVIHP